MIGQRCFHCSKSDSPPNSSISKCRWPNSKQWHYFCFDHSWILQSTPVLYFFYYYFFFAMSYHLIICSDSVAIITSQHLIVHLQSSLVVCLDISGHLPTWHPVIFPPQTHTSCMETREQQRHNPATPWLLSSRSPLHLFFFFVSLEFRLSSRLHASPPQSRIIAPDVVVWILFLVFSFSFS